MELPHRTVPDRASTLNFEYLDKKVEVAVTGPTGPTGPEGDPGIIISDTPPDDTDSLWADTTEAGDVGIGPTGPSGPSGATGNTGATGAGFDDSTVTDTAYNVNSTTPVLVALATPTSNLGANTMYEVDIQGLLLNNSGNARTYVWTIQFNGNTYLTYTEGSTLAAGATYATVNLKVTIAVYSTASAYIQMMLTRSDPQAADTRQAISTSASGHIWNVTANDFTGGGAVGIYCHGQNTTTTQTFTRKTLKAVRLT
jgi:hypothetical protein